MAIPSLALARHSAAPTMLTPSRVLRGVRRRYESWRLRRMMVWRQRTMEQSLRSNEAELSSVHRKRASGGRLTAILLTEHIGDIIACEPVIRYLRQEGPDDRLVWILRADYRELLAAHPQLDGVLGVTCLTEGLRLTTSPLVDHVVNLHVNFRTCTWFGATHRKTGDNTEITVDNYFNFGSLLESFCRSAGLPPLADQPRLYLSPQTATEVDALIPPSPYYVVHATSNETTKDWTVAKWRELLIRQPTAAGATWVEVGLRPELAGCIPGMVNLCGRLSLAQLAEVIRRSAGFIGVDSGPAHMANVFERPSVILLGRYRAFDRYMPYTGFLRDHADDMLIRWDGPASEIPVEVVAAQINRVLSPT